MRMPFTLVDAIEDQLAFVKKAANEDANYLSLVVPPVTSIGGSDLDAHNGLQLAACLKSELKEYLKLVEKDMNIPVGELSSLESGIPEELQSTAHMLMQTINMSYISLINFNLSGRKTFYFNDNIADHLLNTEINLQAEWIKMPFDTCQFVFTSKSVIDALFNMHGDKGRRAMNNGGIDYTSPVSAIIAYRPAGKDLQGNKLVIFARHGDNGMTVKREIYLGPGWSLEEGLRVDWLTLKPDMKLSGFSQTIDKDVIEQQDDALFYQDGLLFFRLILNGILYLSASEPEITPMLSPRSIAEEKAEQLSGKKKFKLRQHAAGLSSLNYSDVGASVGPIVIQKGKVNEGGGEPSSGANKSLRFMVRGHWRQQAYGQQHELRRPAWIRPFFKGPDMVDMINKPYLVK